jgi:hypothetical protein
VGLGQAGNRIKQEQDIVALVAEMLRGRNRAVRRPLLRTGRFADVSMISPGFRIRMSMPAFACLVMSEMPDTQGKKPVHPPRKPGGAGELHREFYGKRKPGGC